MKKIFFIVCLIFISTFSWSQNIEIIQPLGMKTKVQHLNSVFCGFTTRPSAPLPCMQITHIFHKSEHLASCKKVHGILIQIRNYIPDLYNQLLFEA